MVIYTGVFILINCLPMEMMITPFIGFIKGFIFGFEGMNALHSVSPNPARAAKKFAILPTFAVQIKQTATAATSRKVRLL